MGTVSRALSLSATQVTHVCVVVVTYNSARHLPALLDSLAAQHPAGDAAGTRLTVVVADNASADDSVQVASAHPGVTVVRTGGNLGYAAGVNAAVRAAPPADALLVLNPDLVLEPDAVARLVSAMRRTGAAVVVPQIRDRDGAVYPSLRREPTVATAVGDALCGGHLRMRPAAASETVWDPDAYEVAHEVEWATGAALLVRRDVLEAVGDWDEQFFLYSEETDFLRRVRDAGGAIWYEPSAHVCHHQGGSGASADLDVLLTVNRVRYARKHQSAGSARRFRAAVVLGEALRAYRPVHRASLRTLLRESSWEDLPHAHRVTPLSGLTGSIVIPAHDEAGVIARTLDAVAPLADAGIEVIVAANGCSDQTVEVARAARATRVLDLPAPGKTAALNAADDIARSWPRLYLDADITITPQSVLDVFAHLDGGVGALAARPPYVWRSSGADPLVRSYYRARSRMPSTRRALWGAGAYALSQEGHRRVTPFPDVVADDVFVDRAFADEEKEIVPTAPVVVRTPQSTHALLAVLRRQARGPAELGVDTSRSTVRELVSTVRGPLTLLDALVYAGLAVAARSGRAPAHGTWERDTSSRGTP